MPVKNGYKADIVTKRYKADIETKLYRADVSFERTITEIRAAEDDSFRVTESGQIRVVE